MKRLHLKVVARCGVIEGAEVCSAVLSTGREGVRVCVESEPRVYWKRSDHVVMSFWVDPPNETSRMAVLAVEPEGWSAADEEREPAVIWNAGSGRTFVHGAVVWAQLEFVPWQMGTEFNIEPLE